MWTEVATYRLQMHCGFTLNDAAAIADYLAHLEISHRQFLRPASRKRMHARL